MNEPVFLLRKSQLDQLVNYLVSVPTGTLPGARLVQVMNTLDTLEPVPQPVVDIMTKLPRQPAAAPPKQAPPKADPAPPENGASSGTLETPG